MEEISLGYTLAKPVETQMQCTAYADNQLSCRRSLPFPAARLGATAGRYERRKAASLSG